jgi:hypothetical protein
VPQAARRQAEAAGAGTQDACPALIRTGSAKGNSFYLPTLSPHGSVRYRCGPARALSWIEERNLESEQCEPHPSVDLSDRDGGPCNVIAFGGDCRQDATDVARHGDGKGKVANRIGTIATEKVAEVQQKSSFILGSCNQRPSHALGRPFHRDRTKGV